MPIFKLPQVEYIEPVSVGNEDIFGGAQYFSDTRKTKTGSGDTSINSNAQEGTWIGNKEFLLAPFSVDMLGNLSASSAIISGTITATSGFIGGWQINPTTLTSVPAGVTLDSAGIITVGVIQTSDPSANLDRIRIDGPTNSIQFIGSDGTVTGDLTTTFAIGGITGANFRGGSGNFTGSNVGLSIGVTSMQQIVPIDNAGNVNNSADITIDWSGGDTNSLAIDLNKRVNGVLGTLPFRVNLVPEADATRQLGTATNRWKALFLRDVNSVGMQTGEMRFNALTGDLLFHDGVIVQTISFGAGAGTGDVVGPASATDEAIARYDTTTGKLLQNSAIRINDAGDILPVGSGQDLGSNALRWEDLFLGGGATISGDTVSRSINKNWAPDTTATRQLGTATNKWKALHLNFGNSLGMAAGELRFVAIPSPGKLFINTGVIPREIALIDAFPNVVPLTDLASSLGATGKAWVNTHTKLVRGPSSLGASGNVIDMGIVGQIRFTKPLFPTATGSFDLGISFLKWRDLNISRNLNIGGGAQIAGDSVSRTINKNWLPSSNNTFSLGTSTNKWSDVFAVLVQSADFVFANNFRMTEDKHDGILFLNPKGKVVFRISNEGNMEVAGKITDYVGLAEAPENIFL